MSLAASKLFSIASVTSLTREIELDIVSGSNPSAFISSNDLFPVEKTFAHVLSHSVSIELIIDRLGFQAPNV